MRNCLVILVVVLSLASIFFAGAQTRQSVQTDLALQRDSFDRPRKQIPESCPVTKPPAQRFVPPSPYPDKTSPDDFWFGTNGLWTNLRADGTWASLPRWPDGTFRQKLFWWSEGYDWHHDLQPKLKVTGKHLGSPSLPLQLAEHASHGWTDDPDHPFIVVGINIPALGCWKITGRFKDAELSFVVWVTE